MLSKTTLCECGHPKSAHPSGPCDYAGYSCACNRYKRHNHNLQDQNSASALESELSDLKARHAEAIRYLTMLEADVMAARGAIREILDSVHDWERVRDSLRDHMAALESAREFLGREQK